MPTLHMAGDRPEPPLEESGEKVRCANCRAEWTAPEFLDAGVQTPELPDDRENGRAKCPGCDRYGTVYRYEPQPARRLRDRWSEATIDQGWTALPDVLVMNAAALDLDAIDLGLILLYERFRGDNEAAWPSMGRIAELSNLGARTVRRRVDRLVKKGLWERQRHHRADGTRGTDRLTRHGLVQALDLIAANKAGGKEATEGLSALLDGLAGNVVPLRQAA